MQYNKQVKKLCNREDTQRNQFKLCRGYFQTLKGVLPLLHQWVLPMIDWPPWASET